jgi:DNA helicase-2/ATP-dependent DNA helicase PcrA
MSDLNFDATKVVPATEADNDAATTATRYDVSNVLAAVLASRTWSTYQQAIFHFVATGNGNAIVEAVAGSGKSTTIVEAMKLAGGQAIFLAFNKAIADELKRKGVNGKTFHAMVYGPVVRAAKQDSVTMDKVRLVSRDLFSFNRSKLYGAFAARMVGLARGMGIGIDGMLEDTEENWIALANHHDLEPDSDGADFGEAIDAARELFDACMADARVDFDDMLYLAVKDNINLPKFDFVFVDEAQDTNPIQRAIIRKIIAPGGRMVAVGDPAQAIYGFRGADSDALSTLGREFKCITLPLSITYRCPTLVVDYAKQWVSHIEARPGAPEGVVKDLGNDWSPLDFLPNDLVVCRKSAPLIQAAFRFIKAGVPVQVLGRDIGQGLKALIKKMSVRPGPREIAQLESKLKAWRDREVKKHLAEDDEAKAESVRDRADVILFMMDNLAEDKQTIEALNDGIDWLFEDKGRAVIFCTGHKSKGLEAQRVFWLGRSECPAKWARKEWQRQQERNLCYVITTRAMRELYLMEL